MTKDESRTGNLRLQRVDAGLIGVISLVGILAPLRHYLSNRSFWADEASLALNVLDRDILGFMRPLDHNQVAPFAFLILTKCATAVFGGLNEWAFRLLPLLVVLPLGLLTYHTAFMLRGRVAAVFCSLLTVLAPPVTYYAAEFKPYSTDIFATAMLLWMTTRSLGEPASRRRFVEFIGGASVLVTLSLPATLVAASCLAVLTLHLLRHDKGQGLFVFIASVPLATIAAVTLSVAQPPPETSRYMHEYWNSALLTFPPGGPWELKTALQVVTRAFDAALTSRAEMLVLPVGILALSLWLAAALGFALRAEGALLLVLPWLVAVAASRLDLYPLGDRLAVYLLPTITLGLGSTLSALSSDRFKSPRALLGAAFVVTLGLNAGLVLKQSIEREELRAVLQAAIAEWEPGDRIYVYWASGSLHFYRRQLAGDWGVELVYGKNHGSDVNKFAAEIEMTAGDRQTIWVLGANSALLLGGFEELKQALSPRWHIDKSIDRPQATAFLVRRR